MQPRSFARGLESTMMRGKFVAVQIIAIVLLLIFSGYVSLMCVKFKWRNEYHRSRMFEYELLCQISMITPVGTDLSSFLHGFGLDSSAYHQTDESSGYVSIRPDLRIPRSEQRDYTGFHFNFENGKLVSFEPSGPDVAEHKIKLSEVPIGNKLGYWQSL